MTLLAIENTLKCPRIHVTSLSISKQRKIVSDCFDEMDATMIIWATYWLFSKEEFIAEYGAMTYRISWIWLHPTSTELNSDTSIVSNQTRYSVKATLTWICYVCESSYPTHSDGNWWFLLGFGPLSWLFNNTKYSIFHQIPKWIWSLNYDYNRMINLQFWEKR